MLSITTEREENTLFIWCHFISGSDALGCKVVIVNYNPSVKNITGLLMRKGSEQIAEGQFTLNHSNGFCFHRVFAFDVETDNTISGLAIEGFVPLFAENIQCTQCVEKGITILSCFVLSFLHTITEVFTLVLLFICQHLNTKYMTNSILF